MVSFFVIGNDDRTNRIRDMLNYEGKMVNEIKESDYIYCAIPFSKDGEDITGTEVSCTDVINVCKNKILISGGISKEIKIKLKENGIEYYDLMELDEVAILNAIPTAEGAIQKAMEYSNRTLCNSKVVVLGYGRIGKVLAKMLNGLGANVFCEARNEKDLALIMAMGYNNIDLKNLDNFLFDVDYIFNTIPDMILNRERLDKVNKDCIIIDLASNPGGTDFEYAKKIGVFASLELALPSKVASKSAAEYIKKTIDKIVEIKK